MFAQSEQAVGIKTKDEEAKFLEFLGGHRAIVASFVIKFSAASWETLVANSGGSCAGSEGLCV